MNQVESLQKEITRLNKVIEQKDAALKRPLVESEVLKFLQKGNYVLPDDPEIRATRLGILVEKLEDENTRLMVEDGRIFIVDASGQPKENETGTRLLSLDALIESKANRSFERIASDNRRSPGSGGVQKAGTGNMPGVQTIEDFYEALQKETDPAKQRELKQRFDNSQQSTNAKEAYRLETTKDYFRALNATTDPAEQRALKEQFDKSMSQNTQSQTNS